jgi:hypothetical protein
MEISARVWTRLLEIKRGSCDNLHKLRYTAASSIPYRQSNAAPPYPSQQMLDRMLPLHATQYSGPSSYDRPDIRTTWVTTEILVLTYDQSLE